MFSAICGQLENMWLTRLMNALPILDLTFLLNGGLNPMTSLRLFFCFGGLSDNIDATLSFQCF